MGLWSFVDVRCGSVGIPAQSAPESSPWILVSPGDLRDHGLVPVSLHTDCLGTFFVFCGELVVPNEEEWIDLLAHSRNCPPNGLVA